jgi:hypothetical protein
MNRLALVLIALLLSPSLLAERAHPRIVGDLRIWPEDARVGEMGPMTGRIAVAVLLLDSNGQYDEELFDWDEFQAGVVRDGLELAFEWWNTAGQSQGVDMFGAGEHFVRVVPIPFEPLNGDYGSYQETLWVEAAMQSLGYGGYAQQAVANFNADLRAAHGADEALTVFMNNDGGSPRPLADGYMAWAHWGGPWLHMTYTNKGWGAMRLADVATHEIAHVFHAIDEYSTAGYAVCHCDGYGWEWNGCANDNCELVTGQGCSEMLQPCIMGVRQTVAWERREMCPTTKCHIGWSCSDEVCNGIDDDCNGQVDDGMGQTSCGYGECFHQAPNCVNGQMTPCDPAEGARPEECDGRDDDCDGLTDEEFPDFDGDGQADCADWDDDDDGNDDANDCAPQNAKVFQGAEERCNDRDDDCDGLTDEGYDDEGSVCPTQESALCAHGRRAAPPGAAALLLLVTLGVLYSPSRMARIRRARRAGS